MTTIEIRSNTLTKATVEEVEADIDAAGDARVARLKRVIADETAMAIAAYFASPERDRQELARLVRHGAADAGELGHDVEVTMQNAGRVDTVDISPVPLVSDYKLLMYFRQWMRAKATAERSITRT